ncbi:lysophosphatidic acid receptor 2 [Oryzias latipes]|uniref:Lysophosphatidic acid receptor 2a n=1 Tax=Oryzias latipes TaxID=8090 RepID=H2LQ20_ORYLA|nr:lysophosphatidic acid receptor 2 [Oryzias latipes]
MVEPKLNVMASESSESNQCYHNESITFFYANVNKTINENWTPRDITVIALGLTVCVIVLLANLMVMVAIFKNQRFHFPIYYLLGNMAAADLFAGMAYANLMLNTGPWTAELSKKQWYIRGALIDISLTASVANLLAVAVERHQTILTMQLHSNMTKRRVVLLIVCIWAAAILMGLVPSLFWNCECDVSNCSSVAPLYHRRFLIFWAILNLLTFLIMVFIYAHIFIHVKRHWSYISQHSSEVRHNQTVVNLMKTISMVLGAFVICWTPGLMVLLVDGVMGTKSDANRIEKYCLAIAECNSLVNPIIYSLRDDEMRRTFKSILCCLCGRTADQREENCPIDIKASLQEFPLNWDQKFQDQAL